MNACRCSDVAFEDRIQKVPADIDLRPYTTCDECISPNNEAFNPMWCVKGAAFWFRDISPSLSLILRFIFLVHHGVTIPACVSSKNDKSQFKLCDSTPPHSRLVLHRSGRCFNWLRFCSCLTVPAHQKVQLNHLQTIPDCKTCHAIDSEGILPVAWCVGSKSWCACPLSADMRVSQSKAHSTSLCASLERSQHGARII